jgi:hypothetical protein
MLSRDFNKFKACNAVSIETTETSTGFNVLLQSI